MNCSFHFQVMLLNYAVPVQWIELSNTFVDNSIHYKNSNRT